MDGTERRGYGVIKNGSGTEFCTASAADNSCPNLELCNEFFGLSAKYPLLFSRGNMQICINIYDYFTEVIGYSSAFVINFTLIFLRSKTIKSILFKSQYPPLKSEPQSAGIHTFLTIASCPSLVPSAFSGGAITHE